MLLIVMLILTPTIWLVNRPKPYLMAGIYALIFSGVYTIDHSLFDLVEVLIAGTAGYLRHQFVFPFLPLVLGMVLGYLNDGHYRRQLLLPRGDPILFPTATDDPGLRNQYRSASLGDN